MPSKIHFENSHKLKAAQLAEGSQPLPIQYVHIQYALLLNEIMENKPIKPWYLCTSSTLLYVLCNKTLNLLDV